MAGSPLSSAELAEFESKYALRAELLRDVTILQMERDRLVKERKLYSEKVEANKDVLNELRFGPYQSVSGGAGREGKDFWVDMGGYFETMSRREIESKLLQNQVKSRKKIDELNEKITEIDRVFNAQVDRIEQL